MKEFNKDEIINEDREIVNFKKLKKITNSGIEKCICKIKKIVIINGEKKLKSGTGFFCNIPELKMKIFLTNNHVINKEFLVNEKRIVYEIEEKEKEINLELPRYKMTNKDLDFTVFQIINKDNVHHFLETDKYTNIWHYINEQIFSAQYPGGDELNYLHGKIIDKKDNYFLYSVGTLGGSSGSPIILFSKLQVIGLHKGCIYEKEKKINLGIPLNLIIKKININIVFWIKKKTLE